MQSYIDCLCPFLITNPCIHAYAFIDAFFKKKTKISVESSRGNCSRSLFSSFCSHGVTL